MALAFCLVIVLQRRGFRRLQQMQVLPEKNDNIRKRIAPAKPRLQKGNRIQFECSALRHLSSLKW